MAVTIKSVTVRPGAKERELEHKGKMTGVAELITGSDAPLPWFIDELSNQSFEVAWAHSVESMLPTRLELHEDLDSIQQLATKLSEKLRPPITQAFLVTGAGRENEQYIKDGLGFLSMLMRDAYMSKNSPRIVGADGQVQRGAGRPHLPGRMPPKYVCAALIAEAWHFFHGEDPEPSDQKAREAAARFYGAWFPSGGWGTYKLKAWNHYLEAVRHPDLKDVREEFRRNLINTAHFQAQLATENNVQETR